MGVVEDLVIGREGIVRGAIVITKGNPVRFYRRVQKFFPLEFQREGEGTQTLHS